VHCFDYKLHTTIDNNIMVICFIYVNAESIGIGYAILQKYWYWYCNTYKKMYWYWYWQYFFQAILVLVLPILFESIVNNPVTQCPVSVIFLCDEAVFLRISAMGHIQAFHKTYFFVFLMQLGLWRAAPFMSSPIHLFDYPVYIARCRFS